VRTDDMATSGSQPGVLTARAAGLVACLHCARVHSPEVSRCTRCGSALHSRYPYSLQWVWAWWITGLVAYIPANFYPMMYTGYLGSTSPSTIVGGVIELLHLGDWFVAGVVFVASVVIPVAKFIAIGFLGLAVSRPHRYRPSTLHKLYEVVDFIGRWSMIDVFVVAILSALVQLGFFSEVHPGLAAICFATTVISTMLSALSFDARLIYDAAEDVTR
jgi:paraquat-inducible protein A